MMREILKKYNKQMVSGVLVIFSGFLGRILIFELDARTLTWLLGGLFVLFLLLWRPERYVLAFWGFSLLGSLLFPVIARTQLYFLGLSINPLGVLNGLLPLFFAFYLIVRRPNLRAYPVGLILITLSLWATFSLTVGGFRPDKLRDWTTLINMVAAYFFLINGLQLEKSLEKITIYLLSIVIIFNIGVLWGGITGQGMYERTMSIGYNFQIIVRSTGFGTEAQGTGEILALAATVCFAFILGPLKRRKLYMLFFFLVVGVWLTHSRMAVIGLLVAIAFLLWKTKKITPYYMVILIALVVALVVTNKRFDFFSVVGGNIDQRVYTNAFARTNYWKILINDMSLASWLIGNGIRSSFEKLGVGAHNEYVAYLYEFGLFGLVLLIAAMMGIFRYALKIYNQAYDNIARTWALATMAAVISTVMFKFAGTPFGSPASSYSFWLIVAMAYESNRRSQNLPAHDALKISEIYDRRVGCPQNALK